jgi:invasion protein IalB
MTDQIVSASARPLRPSLIAGVAAALLTFAASMASAQAPKPAAGPATPPQPAAGAEEQILYSPWLKQCSKGTEANAKTVCATTRASFAESGIGLASVVLVEAEGDKKILRVTVPEPVALSPGARIVVDQDQPVSTPYITCFHNGCLAEIEASQDLVTRMKSAKTLFVQAVTMSNQVVALPLPLAEFKKVNESPPADEKTVADQQKKLQDELQKRLQAFQQKMQAAQQPPK